MEINSILLWEIPAKLWSEVTHTSGVLAFLHTYITLYTGCPQSNHCKHLCLCFFVVAERRDPVWDDRFWGWQTLSGFQTSESRPEQLLMNDKAWTSCSPFLCTVSFIHTSPPVLWQHIRPVLCCGSTTWKRHPQNPNCTFHKEVFCSDVFVVLRRPWFMTWEWCLGTERPSREYFQMFDWVKCDEEERGFRGLRSFWRPHSVSHACARTDLGLATKVDPLIFPFAQYQACSGFFIFH